MRRVTDVELGAGGTVTADYQEVNRVSLLVLREMERRGVGHGYAALGSALTLGRVLNPDPPLDKEEEIAFVMSVMDFCAAYFADTGGVVH